jgi:hypothetical protein
MSDYQTSAGSISMSIAFQIMIDRVAVIERQLGNVERGY